MPKLIATFLVIGIFFSSGCLFKRLLEFKKQMETPEKYISFEQKGVLNFKKPVLQIEDLVLLTGIEPTDVKNHTESKTIATYLFIRDENITYSLDYQCIFIDGKLTTIDYPDQFFNQVSSGFAFSTLKSFGDTELTDTKSWKLKARKFIKNIFIPSKKLVEKLVGPPTTTQSFPLTDYYTYIYRHPTERSSQTISISYEFSKKNQRITTIFIQFPDRNWQIDI